MTRLTSYTSPFGENWVLGRYLLPELRRLGRDQTGVMLDLACGESPFLEYFPKVVEYIRIDRTPLSSDVRVGDILAIPLPEQAVDVVLLSQAITDVPDLLAALSEVHRVLRVGGRLLLFESMHYPEHDAPDDYFRLMPEGLRSLANGAGLHMQSCIRLGGLFTRFSTLWNAFLMRRLKMHAPLRPLAHLGVLSTNLLLYGADRLAPHPRLASDYLAILTKAEPAP